MAALLTISGEGDDAIVHGRTALSIAADDRLVWMESQCHAALGTLLAYRGDWHSAESHIARANEPAVGTDNVEALATARIASACLARARNQPEHVVRALASLPRFVPILSALYFWPPLISALIDAGRLDEAANQVEALAAAAKARRINDCSPFELAWPASTRRTKRRRCSRPLSPISGPTIPSSIEPFSITSMAGCSRREETGAGPSTICGRPASCSPRLGPTRSRRG